MFETAKKKREPLVFRPSEIESEKLRHIANAYGVSLSDVVRELINKPISLDQMHDLAKGKHNSKTINNN